MNTSRERSCKSLFAAVFLVGLVASCTPPGGPPRRPEPAESASSESSPPSTQAGSPRPASSTDVGVGPRALPPDPRLPTVDVEDTSGKPRKGPETALAPVRRQMQECTGGKTGVVRVRIKTEKNRTSMDVEPGSTLDSSAHRCVLETLSTVDVDELSQGSPSDRPSSGFTSVLRVEW